METKIYETSIEEMYSQEEKNQTEGNIFGASTGEYQIYCTE